MLSFDSIESVEYLSDGEVFDLTIDEQTPNYFTADGILHHNSGKDFVCSILQAYVVHILLCLRSPQQFFGFAPGEPCDILNIGKKGEQAQRVYFSKFRARLLSWKWMLERYNVVDEGKTYSKAGKNLPICKIGTRSAEWVDKTVRAFAENSGNPESLEGYNIIFYLCDEISGWTSEKGRQNAVKILNILRTSQGSRNTKSLKGIGMAISYPRQDDDIMFDIEAESKKPDTKVFFSRAYQWEAKPKRFYSGQTFRFNAGTEEDPDWFDIPVELDRDFFLQYPEKAKCVYLLRPPAVGGQFFEFTDKIDAIAYSSRQPLFKIATELIEAVDGHNKKVTYIRKRILGLNRAADPNVDYVAWLDAAETMCDASLSIGHLETVTILEGTQRAEVTAVVLDDTIVWEPDPDKRIIVDIGSMATACIDMRKYISLKSAWWDQWNSGTGMFDLRLAGILCDKHNLVGEDYDFFKGVIYTNRFIGPEAPQVRKGIAQIKHLSRTRTGNVTPGSTRHKKDIADTWCGVTALLLGTLSGKNLRIGRAPSAITIMGKNTTTGIPAGQGATAAANPFAPIGSQSRASALVRDHSDMFRALNPGSSSPMARVPQGGGNSGRSAVPKPAGTRPVSRFPRGLTM